MSDLELWPSLDSAWQAVLSARAGKTGSGAHWALIQGKSRTRVLRIQAPGFRSLVLKIYAVPAHLAWRTLGVTSRANREFTLMMNACRKDLPLVRPRYWLEQRVVGGLRFSALALDAIDGTDLEEQLASPDITPIERRRLAQQTGDVLGRMHRAGVYWATSAPRNLLSNEGDPSEPLLAIDFPYATQARGGIVGSDRALLDLSCALRMRNGDMAFEGDDRESLVLAYCENNSEAARAMNTRIVLRNHHAWRLKRLKQRLRNLLMSRSGSAGPGGRFDDSDGSYQRLETGAVFLPGRDTPQSH